MSAASSIAPATSEELEAEAREWLEARGFHNMKRLLELARDREWEAHRCHRCESCAEAAKALLDLFRKRGVPSKESGR